MYCIHDDCSEDKQFLGKMSSKYIEYEEFKESIEACSNCNEDILIWDKLYKKWVIS